MLLEQLLLQLRHPSISASRHAFLFLKQQCPASNSSRAIAAVLGSAQQLLEKDWTATAASSALQDTQSRTSNWSTSSFINTFTATIPHDPRQPCSAYARLWPLKGLIIINSGASTAQDLQFGCAALQLQLRQAFSTRSSSSGGDSNGSSSTGSVRGSRPRSSPCSSAIQAAVTPSQLLQVLQQHAHNMSALDISTAFARAAKLSSQRGSHGQQAVQQQLRQVLQQLADRLHSQQQQQDPAGDSAAVAASALAAIIYACGSLRLPAVAELMLPLLLQQETLQQASTRSLSNVVYGVAKTKAALQDIQLQQLLSAFSAQLPAANAQDISNVLWAVADMGWRMPAQQLSPYLKRYQSVLNSARIQAVKDVLWAVATVKQKVPDPQLQLFMDRMTRQDCLAAASAQLVSNSLWAVATMQGTVSEQHLQLLLGAFMQKLPSAGAQGIKDILWAVVTLGMGRQLQQQQQWGMLHQFWQLLPAAQPQHISTLLWALAKLQGSFGATASTAQPAAELTARSAAAISPAGNSPAGQKPVSEGFLRVAVDHLAHKWAKLSARDIAVTLWACSELGYYPLSLLDLLRQKEREKRLQQILGRAEPKSLASMVYACARLGFSSGELPAVLLQQAVQRLDSSSSTGSGELPGVLDSSSSGGGDGSSRELPAVLLQQAAPRVNSSGSSAGGGSGELREALLQQDEHSLDSSNSSGGGCSGSNGSSSNSAGAVFKPQAHSKSFTGRMLSNLCWAAAVLDLRECIPLVLQLAAACSRDWEGLGAENVLQLYQVHLWLQDCAAADNQQPRGSQQQQQQHQLWLQDSQQQGGLSGVLEAQQLEQCRASWQQQLQQQISTGRTSKRQRTVFALLRELSDTVQWQQAPAMEQLTPDGNYSIDIAAVTAKGTKVAIEVDGSWHYLQPGNVLDGPTKATNRALAARGYVVISVPIFELRELNTEQRRAYLLAKIQAVD